MNLDALAALAARETDAYRAAHPASARLRERALRDLLFLYLANRGLLVGCFGGAAVVSPHTTPADVDALLDGATSAITEIGALV